MGLKWNAGGDAVWLLEWTGLRMTPSGHNGNTKEFTGNNRREKIKMVLLRKKEHWIQADKEDYRVEPNREKEGWSSEKTM